MFLVATLLVLLLSAAWYYYSTRLRHIIAGPKLVLAKAIASAASAYFVVPASLIEAKLLLDSQIVLRNLQLQPHSTILATKNGSTVTVRTTGTVKRVTFSWSWALSNAWIQNATLAITGVQIHAKISFESDVKNKSPSSNTTQQQQEADDEADTEQAAEGFHAIIQRQVQMVLDSLDLNVCDFELTIELPEDAADHLHKGVTVQIGTKAFTLTSSGRLELGGVLQQPATLTAFYANVLLDGGTDATAATTTAQPLVDPFTFSVDTTRTGQRFDDWRTNVVVMGQSATDFVVHAESVQLCALSRLGALLTAPPSDSNNRRNPPQKDSDKTGNAAFPQESKAPSPNTAPLHSEKPDGRVSGVAPIEESSPSKQAEAPTAGTSDSACAPLPDNPSTFSLDFSSMSLILDSGAKVNVPNVKMRYRADGTIMSLQAQQFLLVNSKDASVDLSGIRVSMVPPASFSLDRVDEFYLAETIRLTQPIANVKIVEEGSTISIDLESIEAIILSPAVSDDSTNKENTSLEKDGQQEDSSSNESGFSFPCLIKLSMGSVQLTDSTDGSVMRLQDLDIFARPEDQSTTQIAMELGSFQNEILQLTKIQFCGSLSVDKMGEIDKFHLGVESGRVTAGHSVSEWAASFKFAIPQFVSQKGSVWKVPNAKVEQLKLVISYKMTKWMKVKDTNITIKPFNGQANTTTDDMVKYYADVCLCRVPDFIPNAEVLGLNVVDSTATALGGLFLPCGGVALVAGVDGIKATFAAGKKHRHAEEGASYRPLDFIRGAIHNLKRCEDHGAAIRGEHDGNHKAIFDFAAGAAVDTEKYVRKNKDKLAVATAGGVGYCVGMGLGGPVGSILLGVGTQIVASRIVESRTKTTKTKTR